MPLRPVLHWQLESPSGDAVDGVDPVVLRLLAAIEERGTLRAAAQDVGVSYRHAWGILSTWSERLGAPLVRLHRGRGARLAPLGEAWLRLDRDASRRLLDDLDALSAELDHAHRLHAGSRAEPLRLCASHGFEIVRLRDALGHAVELELRGSLESLQRLRASACDAAGFHVPLGRLGRRLWPRYAPLLDGRRVALYHVATRRQGLMVAASTAARVRTLADLAASPGPRFVNRQRGSGTRLLFDELLAEQGIDADAVNGYGTEEHTHTAVAATVASGTADAGFGVEDAARSLGLTFLPMAVERYTLAVDRGSLDDPRVTGLIGALRGLPAATDAGGGGVRAGTEVALESLLDDPREG